MSLINVVAPIYNEQGVAKQFVNELMRSLEVITEDYKILLVDDGSNDKSWAEISDICRQHSKVMGVKLSKNFGQHYAITAGLHLARSEWVVVMDSDLQDRPEVIPDLYRKASEGFDVVFVNRVKRPESLLYKFLQKLFYLLLRNLSGIKFDSRQANFSILNFKVVEAFKKFPEQSRFYGSIIKWLGFKVSSIDATHGHRFFGKPSYTFKKRVKLAFDIILAFSDRPLMYAIYFGMAISLMCLSAFLLIFGLIFAGNIPLNNTLVIIMSTLFVSGTQLMLICLIGIYISRIFHETKKRPLFVVDKILNSH